MSPVNSPASASPSTLAGMNPPPSDSGQSGSGDEASGGSPSQLAGGSPQPDPGAKVAKADAKLSKDIEALRGAEASLMEMAQSYPTATKALRAASEAIRSAQRQIVSSPGQMQPPVPNTTS